MPVNSSSVRKAHETQFINLREFIMRFFSKFFSCCCKSNAESTNDLRARASGNVAQSAGTTTATSSNNAVTAASDLGASPSGNGVYGMPIETGFQAQSAELAAAASSNYAVTAEGARFAAERSAARRAARLRGEPDENTSAPLGASPPIPAAAP